MCIGVIRNSSLVDGRSQAESNLGHWARYALLHMAAECVKLLTTKPRGQVTCRRLSPQKWLPRQRPLTKVRPIFGLNNFFIDGVNATIRVVIRPPVVEWEGRNEVKITNT